MMEPDEDERATLRQLKKELEEELSHRSRYHCRKGSRADFLRVTCFVVAIAASLLASLSAMANWLPHVALGVIAGLPATLSVIQSKLRERQRWHFQYYHGLRALYRELHYQGSDPRELASRVSALGFALNDQMPANKSEGK